MRAGCVGLKLACIQATGKEAASMEELGFRLQAGFKMVYVAVLPRIGREERFSASCCWSIGPSSGVVHADPAAGCCGATQQLEAGKGRGGGG